MPSCQPSPALRAQLTKKRHYVDYTTDSTDSRNSVGLHGQRDALPTPPLSISQSEPNYVGHTNALNALESSDPLKVRAALAKMDIETLLDQINKPKRPKWQTVIDDWYSVKVPQPIFDKWNAQRNDWDHLYFEYNRATETMIIKCMPSPVHERVPSRFVQQASVMIDRLSREAKKVVDIGSTEGMYFSCADQA
jgi:hypothetical protein